MGFAPTIRCSECLRYLADAATERRRRGLPQRSPYSSTCSDRCDERRETRFRREARERGYELAPGGWRCEECGLTGAEVLSRRTLKDRCFPFAVRVVCSPKCALARKYRRNVAVLRELQLTPKEKARRSAWERERRKTAAGRRES